MKFTRRHFMMAAGTGIAAAAMPAFGTGTPVADLPASTVHTFRLAVAGYTFAKIDLDQSLVMMKRVGMNLLGIKDFHLPYDSPKEKIDQTLAKMKAFGVEPYCVGPIYMKSEQAVDQAFAFAGLVGVTVLVGVPDIQFLPYVEKKVKETGIRLAIHNHGPDNPLYSSAEDVWKEIKNLDPRMGFCLDIGHTMRLGLDPIEAVKKYHERIYDIHIWDADKPEKTGGCVEAGRGIIDFPKFFRTLSDLNYTGTASLEYTKDMTDPLAGVAESIGYFKGVISATLE